VKVPADRARIIILENNLSEIGALALERRMIKWYGRKDIGTGILRNLTDGGDMPPNVKGIIRSTEYREKMSKIKTGFIFSEDARKNMSIAKVGKLPACTLTRRAYTGSGNPNYGKIISEEQKEKMRASLLRTRQSKANTIKSESPAALTHLDALSS